MKCPKCGSEDVKILSESMKMHGKTITKHYSCKRCKHSWDAVVDEQGDFFPPKQKGKQGFLGNIRR